MAAQKMTLTSIAAAMLAALLLAACGHEPMPQAASTPSLPPPAPAAVPTPPPPASFNNLTDYKAAVAGLIALANRERMFSGAIPPLLPAIVVVEISINRDGTLHQVRVVRSRDDEASDVALAAVKRGTPFPSPQHLLASGHSTLDFSETFLFIEGYRFQLRSLVTP